MDLGMPTDVKTDNQTVHQLIDRLDPAQLSAVVKLLEVMTMDPVARAIAAAPEDDEPETGDERQAVARSKAWLAEHECIPHEKIAEELGLA
ncbi:MAG: hypothetical protein AAB225_26940 [Acidobacteriota bacterium]